MEEKNLALSAELIGLRGGLSLISKYTDEIKRCQHDDQLANEETKKKAFDLQKINEKCELIEADISIQEEYCENLRKEYAKIKSSSPDLIATVYGGQPVAPRYSDTSAKRWGWLLGLCFVVVILCVWRIRTDPMIYILFPAFLATLISNHIIFRPIIHLVRCGKHRKKMANYKKSVLQSKDNSIKKEEQDLEEMKAVRKDAILERKNAELDLQKQVENEIQRNRENAEMISILAEKSHAVNESLRATYNVLLLECDWNNVDLVLHYIETGRAESLKEALQQVDRQRQTDQITNAIKSASAAMSSHLESAFSRLGDALAGCFGRLNASIQDATSQFERQLEISQRMANEANQQLLDRLDKQISATEMQSILLEKANKSSDELLYDLRYNQKFWRK